MSDILTGKTKFLNVMTYKINLLTKFLKYLSMVKKKIHEQIYVISLHKCFLFVTLFNWLIFRGIQFNYVLYLLYFRWNDQVITYSIKLANRIIYIHLYAVEENINRQGYISSLDRIFINEDEFSINQIMKELINSWQLYSPGW